MKSAERSKAIELRIKHKLGYGAIAKRIKVSKSTLSYWLKDLPLSDDRILQLRREAWSRGQASRELFRKTMREKRQARENTVYLEQKRKLGKLSEQSLFVAGLMLYLAEGSKKNPYSICFSNTDPEIIKFFVSWMERFMDIPRSRMKGQLHLYASMDIAAEKRFWARELGLRKEQFYKDQIRPLKPASFSYAESFRHGTCQVYSHGWKPKTELMLSIKAFLDTYSKTRA